jgi:hypothetical protein
VSSNVSVDTVLWKGWDDEAAEVGVLRTRPPRCLDAIGRGSRIFDERARQDRYQNDVACLAGHRLLAKS